MTNLVSYITGVFKGIAITLFVYMILEMLK